MSSFIDRLNQERARARNRTYFNPKAPIQLKYVREEPPGWPLTRPATRTEWAHVLRVLIMRRIPKDGPIHRGKLIKYAQDDLIAASNAGRLYVGDDFVEMRRVYTELDRMIGQAQIVRALPVMEDPEMMRPDRAIYRTEYAERWLDLVPVTVRAVADFMPTTSALDLMVQALLDAHEEDHLPPEQQTSPPE